MADGATESIFGLAILFFRSQGHDNKYVYALRVVVNIYVVRIGAAMIYLSYAYIAIYAAVLIVFIARFVQLCINPESR